MNLLELSRCRWKNFLSTGNAWTEIVLNSDVSTLITGQNGSGKSTILDALCYALYGRPFRSIKKRQLVNSINGKGLCVEVEFTTNGKKYKIIRGYKPNLLEVWENGKPNNQDAMARDQQKYIEETILKMNLKTFSQMVILGSTSFIPFMQLHVNARREVIEDLLDIRIFSTMSILLKERVLTNRQGIMLRDKDMTNISSLLKLQTRQSELNLESQADKFKEYEERITDLRERITGAKNHQHSEQDLVTEFLNAITDADSNHKNIDRVLRLERDLEIKRGNKRKDIEFYENHDHCPVCTQDIDEELKRTKIGEKQTIIDQIGDALIELAQKLIKYNDRAAEIRVGKTAVEAHQSLVDHHAAGILHDKHEIDIIEREAATLRTTSVKDNAEEIAALEEDLARYTKERDALIEERQLLEIASVILRDSGIKSRIIKQYVPIVNTLVNKYLAAMDFFVKFELDENFKEKILSRHRDDFTYDSFSEGEKKRIDLALLFTWRTIAKMKNSASCNLLILDEVFDTTLDINGCDDFLKMMNDVDSSNIFVISPKGDLLIDKFNAHIHFQKHKNYSRIALAT